MSSKSLSTPLSALISTQSREIITLSASDSVKQAIQTLASNKILSAPVYENDTCIGLVDILDVLYWTMDIGAQSQEMKHTLMQSAMEVENVGNVLDVSKRNPYVPMTPNHTVADLLKQFSNGIHRIPIVPPNSDKVIFIFSQSVAFRWCCDLKKGLFLNEQWFQNLLDKRVNELNLGTQSRNSKQIFTVSEEQTAMEAFSLMRQHGLSAIAIVSKRGQIVANISASDVEGYLEQDYFALGEKVTEFLMKLQKDGNTLLPVVYCQPEHTFREVLERLLPNRVHRIYVVRGDDVNVDGVITLGDIFSFLYAEWQKATQG